MRSVLIAVALLLVCILVLPHVPLPPAFASSRFGGTLYLAVAGGIVIVILWMFYRFARWHRGFQQRMVAGASPFERSTWR